MFVACYLLCGCVLCGVCLCLLFGAHCWLAAFVVCGVMCVVRCVLSVVRWWCVSFRLSLVMSSCCWLLALGDVAFFAVAAQCLLFVMCTCLLRVACLTVAVVGCLSLCIVRCYV